MDVGSQQLLASSRFTSEQDTGVGSRHLRRLTEDVAERVTSSDHLRRIADDFPIALVLALQIRSLERVLDDEQYSVARERLLEKVEGTASCRLDRVANRRVPGDHHHRCRILALLQRA